MTHQRRQADLHHHINQERRAFLHGGAVDPVQRKEEREEDAQDHQVLKEDRGQEVVRDTSLEEIEAKEAVAEIVTGNGMTKRNLAAAIEIGIGMTRGRNQVPLR